jgi:hypothetical protein
MRCPRQPATSRLRSGSRTRRASARRAASVIAGIGKASDRRDEDVDVHITERSRYFVPDNRIAEDDFGGSGVLVVQDHGSEMEEVDAGELVADVLTVPRSDLELHEEVVDDFLAGDDLTFGPSLRARFDSAPQEWVDAAEAGRLGDVELTAADLTRHYEDFMDLQALADLTTDPGQALTNPRVLDLLTEHPLAAPELDGAKLEQLHGATIGELPSQRPTRLRVYLLGNDELAEVGFPDNPFL